MSWIGSLQIFLTLFLCTLSGRLTDAGYVRPTVSIGAGMIVLGTFMTSLATKYWEILLAQGILTGMGMGILFMPSVSIIGSYFQKYKSMALGISAAGSGTGGIIFPLVVGKLWERIGTFFPAPLSLSFPIHHKVKSNKICIGFAWAVRIQAFIALLFSLLILLLLKPRLPPRKAGPIVEWSAFKEPTYLLFTIGVFLIFWALYYVFFYVNSYAQHIAGLSQPDAANLLIVVSAVGIPVRPVLGLAADKYFGVLNTLIFCSTVLGAMLYAWMAVRTVQGMYGWAVVYSIATGATQGIFVGALASLTEEPSKLGTRFGMVCSILAFATLSGPPIAGVFVQATGGGYVAADVWAGTATVAGALFVAFAASEKGLLGPANGLGRVNMFSRKRRRAGTDSNE